MKKICLAISAAAASLVLVFSTAGPAVATVNVQDRSISAIAQDSPRPMSEPPGPCSIWEWGLIKQHNGRPWQCQEVHGELWWVLLEAVR